MAYAVQYLCQYRAHWYDAPGDYEDVKFAINACVRLRFERGYPCRVVDEEGRQVYRSPVQDPPERKPRTGSTGRRCCK